MERHGKHQTGLRAPDELTSSASILPPQATPVASNHTDSDPPSEPELPSESDESSREETPSPLVPRLEAFEDPDDSGYISEPMPFALFVLFEAGLAPLALLAGIVVGMHPLEKFAWDGNAVTAGVMAALPMLALLAVIMRWPVGPFARIKAFFEQELVPALRDCEWPDLAVLSVAAGIGEEMLFRGVIQGVLGRWLGPLPGLFLASTLFGLLHPISLTYVLLAGVLGAYLGMIWEVSGNLLTVMVTHALYDFVALILLVRVRDSQPESDAE